MMSGSVWFKAWPMCSEPVTLGGGSTIVNAGRSEVASAVKAPISSQNAYHFGSTA
jgi:hypothetical protein